MGRVDQLDHGPVDPADDVEGAVGADRRGGAEGR